MEIQKFEYLENKKSFLDETSIFDNYLRAISCWSQITNLLITNLQIH